MILSRWLKKTAQKVLLRLFPLVLLASLADAALLFVVRLFMRIVGGKVDVPMGEWLLAALSLAVLRWLFSYWRGISVEKASRYVEAVLSIWFARRLRTLSPRFFHRRDADENLMVAYDSIRIIGSSVEMLMQAVQAVLQLIVFLPVLFVISPRLTFLVLLVVLPVVSFVQKKLHAMAPSVEEEMAKRGTLRLDVENAKILFRRWSSPEDRQKIGASLSQKIRQVQKSGILVGGKKVALSQGMEAVSVSAVVLVLGFCGWMILRGNLDAESLVLYCSALFLCYKPVKDCARILPQMRQARSAQKTLLDLESAPRKKCPNVHRADFLVFSEVSFSYAPEEKGNFVFQKWNGQWDAETPVLLRGANGCGKSTFFKLISGLEEPCAGRIFLPQKYALHGVFSVSQDLALPPREFIGEAVSERLGEKEFADFYSLIGGENLLKKQGLSGGEKAKVALLWALASSSRILLLDEPFAFVAQKERENLLLAFLLAAEKYGKWTFLVSHESLSEKLACRFTLVNLEECK